VVVAAVGGFVTDNFYWERNDVGQEPEVLVVVGFDWSQDQCQSVSSRLCCSALLETSHGQLLCPRRTMGLVDLDCSVGGSDNFALCVAPCPALGLGRGLFRL
jgi:hypothetical protein